MDDVLQCRSLTLVIQLSFVW